MSIIQWNIRGYKSNYCDLIGLLKEHSPMCVVIQETMLGFKNPIAPNGYTMKCYLPVAQQTPGSGLAILAHRSAALTSIALNTALQAMGCRVGLKELITVCNIYILTPKTSLHSMI